MKHHRTLIAIAVAGLLAGGCATERQTQTAVGAGTGAVAGGLLGSIIGDSGRSTAVGAAVGAGVGAAAGYNWDLIKQKLGMGTKDSGVQVTEQRDGTLKVNVPGSVSFASGSATITPSLYPTLNNIATTLNEYPNTLVTVVGHTDSVGDSEYNRDLSRRRAAAVADYLAQRGVNRGRMIVEGRGEEQPVADNGSESGRAQNRRVEMVIRPSPA